MCVRVDPVMIVVGNKNETTPDKMPALPGAYSVGSNESSADAQSVHMRLCGTPCQRYPAIFPSNPYDEGFEERDRIH